jgi:hypothetical protein
MKNFLKVVSAVTTISIYCTVYKSERCLSVPTSWVSGFQRGWISKWICALVVPDIPDENGLHGFLNNSQAKKQILFLTSSQAEVLDHIWVVKSAMCHKFCIAFRHYSKLCLLRIIIVF